MKTFLAAATIALAAVSSAANAQNASGQNEYIIACAICHGESGKGNGTFASLLSIEVPSLTRLAAENEGEFPFLKTFMVIDGRTALRGHGSPMPVWGDRFMTSASEYFGPYGADVVTRGRILSLVYHLESIQEP